MWNCSCTCSRPSPSLYTLRGGRWGDRWVRAGGVPPVGGGCALQPAAGQKLMSNRRHSNARLPPRRPCLSQLLPVVHALGWLGASWQQEYALHAVPGPAQLQCGWPCASLK